jgi:sirohydrochlorin ferrochelatase
MPFFDNLRLYLSHFPGQEATVLEVTASHPGDAEALWSTLRDALGHVDEGAAVEVRGTTGTVERVSGRQLLVRLTAPVPGMLNAFAFDEGEGRAMVGVRAYLFSAGAADYVRREEPAWRAWLEGLFVPA